ncbi:MAG: D-aminoacylase, partial [Gemmatimonadaceae bacterium]|nr:D-aminoacylase [Gloeobacterales cyanobacterium ES-bin-141]
MHSTTVQVLGALLLIGLAQPAVAELLTDATIYDGSGNAPYTGRVRIEGGRIRAIGQNLKARPGESGRSLSGFALAPGFIDMHSHADRALSAMPGAETAVRQGITTVLVGQDGYSP